MNGSSSFQAFQKPPAEFGIMPLGLSKRVGHLTDKYFRLVRLVVRNEQYDEEQQYISNPHPHRVEFEYSSRSW